MVLLTRIANLRQAHLASCIEDIRILVDAVGLGPVMELRVILEQM